MRLTDEQKDAAERQYRISQLTADEAYHKRRLDVARAELDAAQEKFDKLEAVCPHPLIMRETENKGSTGNWDRDDSYWTAHHCLMCGNRWRTNQSWERRGNKMGHPDDEAAKSL